MEAGALEAGALGGAVLGARAFSARGALDAVLGAFSGGSPAPFDDFLAHWHAVMGMERTTSYYYFNS